MAKSITEILGPFNPKAETLGCLITIETKPNHHKILARWSTPAECSAGYAAWKNGN